MIRGRQGVCPRTEGKKGIASRPISPHFFELKEFALDIRLPAGVPFCSRLKPIKPMPLIGLDRGKSLSSENGAVGCGGVFSREHG